MEKYLNRGIKDIIKEFPMVADVLNLYKIGCTNCSVGSCALKDIVEIHPLKEDEEAELMRLIAQAISPNGTLKFPKTNRENRAKPQEHRASPPIAELMEEHKLIKRLIALLPAIAASISAEIHHTENDLVLKIVDFIRNYADKFHHAKEEDILFKYFTGNKQIIKVMLEDHVSGREHVKALLEAMIAKDSPLLKKYLSLYGKVITEHIIKEDEVLYPLMDRSFTDRQVGELHKQFNAINETFKNSPQIYTDLITSLEATFSQEKK